MPDHREEERLAESKRIIRSLGQSRRAFRDNDGDLSRELPPPAEDAEPEPSSDLATTIGRLIAVVLIFATIAFFVTNGGGSRP
jgi:hypothetical protein